MTDIAAARVALASDPDNLDLQARLARTLCRAVWDDTSKWSAYYREAAAIYRRLLKREPENAVYLVNLGAVLSDQGQHSRALEYYRQAEALGWNDRNLDFNIGVALLNLRNADAGAEYMRSSSKKRKSGQTIEAYFDPHAH